MNLNFAKISLSVPLDLFSQSVRSKEFQYVLKKSWQNPNPLLPGYDESRVPFFFCHDFLRTYEFITVADQATDFVVFVA